MHSKIYKAKLISVHSAQKEEKTPEKPEKAIAIHAYFGMLQHIFQRNKHMIKELKLSGTKIQHKSRQNIKALIQGKKQSDLVRSNIKQQNQSQPQFQQLLRQTSLHSHSPMASQRYQSVQPRYLRKMTQKSALYNPKEQIPQFIPIGQASQKKFGLSKQIQNGNDNCLRSQGFIILKFNNNNYLKQGKTEKQIPQASRKNSIRANRRKLTTKSQPNEQVTSYSSIRTSQNSKKEVKTARKLAKLPQEVTPW